MKPIIDNVNKGQKLKVSSLVVVLSITLFSLIAIQESLKFYSKHPEIANFFKSKPLNIPTSREEMIVFCQESEKLGSVIEAFSATQFPVAGFPGVTLAISKESPVRDLCNFIITQNN